MSDVLNVSYGVPQGSVLGPQLFIMYINDICNASDMLKFISFADDTNVFCADSDLTRLVKAINTELDKLNVWFAVNKLSLNVNKMNYIIFGNCRYDRYNHKY